jgi:hypothetical protein
MTARVLGYPSFSTQFFFSKQMTKFSCQFCAFLLPTMAIGKDEATTTHA